MADRRQRPTAGTERAAIGRADRASSTDRCPVHPVRPLHSLHEIRERRSRHITVSVDRHDMPTKPTAPPGRHMRTITTEPVTYGTPGQAARLIESTTKIVEHEPNCTFADDEVRISARRLVNLLILRLDGEVPDED